MEDTTSNNKFNESQKTTLSTQTIKINCSDEDLDLITKNLTSRRRRHRGRRGRMNIGRTDLRMAALIIVVFVAGAIAWRAGFINPLGVLR